MIDTSWARSRPAGVVRGALLHGVLGPLMDLYTHREITGREHLAGVEAPVLFVSTHASHMDTPALLRALPREWRRRTAVAAAADYFFEKRWLATVVSLAFNTVPVARKGEGAEGASELMQLLEDGWSIVIFAEGTRSRDGTVGRLRSGAALLAAERELPIVPVYVAGTHEVMPPGRGWPRRAARRRRHPIAVHFGAPIRPREGEHRTEVMEHVRQFLEACGARTTPDKRVAARRESATS